MCGSTSIVALPPGRERLGVVVPWDARTFQYTVKDVGRPAHGRLQVDGVTHDVGDGVVGRARPRARLLAA